MHITAPPGIGKTRLLRDVFTRLRASGARAIWISAFAGDRGLSYALASDIVGMAGTLSGASGVSTAAASSLIALNPKLSSSFAAPQGHAVGEEALRRRVHAVTELFEALADESPIALFIDDMHWSDTVSRQLLESAFSRVGECRIFLVTSARTVPDGALNLPATESITLDPLDEAQVEQLISSFSSFADRSIATVLVHALHENTGGSPFLILENLHLAMERGILTLHDGEWIFRDPQQLIESISRADVLEQRLRKLDDRLFRILLLLAVAEEPTSSALVAATLGNDRVAVESGLASLEQHALASTENTRWRCAHDSIADAVLRLAPADDHVAMHGALGISLAESELTDLEEMRVALRHLQLAGHSREVERLFARSVTLARSQRDQRSNVQLASMMLGETSPSEASIRLARSLPLSQRFGIWTPARFAGVLRLHSPRY
jgi:predicted ATPase